MRQRLIITEDEKKNIKSQYEGEFNKDFYDFLQHTISVKDTHIEGMKRPFVMLYIGDDSRLLNNSKKYLVSLILNEYGDEFPDLPESTLRLTAKYFISQVRKKFYNE
jgi:hypothetical protein